MKTNLIPCLSIIPDQVTADAVESHDLTRRDGTIGGVMLSTKTEKLDRVFGLAKLSEDFSF